MKTRTLNALTVATLFFVTICSFGQRGERISGTAMVGTPTTCLKTLKTERGKVFAAAPGVITLKDCQSDEVTITVTKTDGKAETQINIYVDNQMQQNPINFDNGSLIPAPKTRTITGTKGKKVVIKVVNQSVANTFSYVVKIEGQSNNLIKGDNTGTLIGNEKITLETLSNCANKAKIIVKRKDGNARATIRVWEKQINGTFNERVDLNKTFEKEESTKEIDYDSNKSLKIELKNVSIGNNFKYEVIVKPLN